MYLPVCSLNRELGHLAKAGPMLEAPARDSWRGMPRQIAGNLLSALGTVLLLISPPSPTATEKVWKRPGAYLICPAGLQIMMQMLCLR